MGFPTKSGGKKNSKFRAARHDRENEPKEEKPAGHLEAAEEEAGKAPHREKGPRAQMHEMEGVKQGNPEQEPDEPGMEESPEQEQMEEQVAPGLHDHVKQMVAQHGPAHDVHVAHDHEAGVHTVSHKHPTGFQHTQTHNSALHAHHHAMHAAGLTPQEHEEPGQMPPQGGEGQEEEYPL